MSHLVFQNVGWVSFIATAEVERFEFLSDRKETYIACLKLPLIMQFMSKEH